MAETLTIRTASSTEIVKIAVPGPQGATGQGVPVGGSTGQVLRKKTSTDYDTEWAAAGSGSGSVTSVALASTDLTISGSPITDSGTITANIAANAVTLEKLQTISSQHLLGRHGSGNGGVQQVGLGTGLAMSGSNIQCTVTAPTASSATPSALGTASSGSSSDYARADHTHSAEVSDSAFRVTGSTDATKKVALEVDTNVPANTTITLTAPSSGGTIALAGAAPAAHKNSHAVGQSDALAPSDIGAQSIFQVADAAINTGTLTASRAKIWNLSDFTNSSYNLKLPRTNAQVGDIVVIRVASNASWGANSQVTIGYDFEDTPGVPDFISLITISQKGVQYRYQCTVANSFGASYTLIDVDTHTHLATAISDSSSVGRSVLTAADAAAARSAISAAAASHSHELTALAATGATNGHVLTANGSNGATFAALPASGVTGAASSASDVLGVSGANITGVDAGSADRLVFWDDSANKLTYLEAGSGLTISGTVMTASGGASINQAIAVGFVLN